MWNSLTVKIVTKDGLWLESYSYILLDIVTNNYQGKYHIYRKDRYYEPSLTVESWWVIDPDNPYSLWVVSCRHCTKSWKMSQSVGNECDVSFLHGIESTREKRARLSPIKFETEIVTRVLHLHTNHTKTKGMRLFPYLLTTKSRQ